VGGSEEKWVQGGARQPQKTTPTTDIRSIKIGANVKEESSKPVGKRSGRGRRRKRVSGFDNKKPRIRRDLRAFCGRPKMLRKRQQRTGSKEVFEGRGTKKKGRQILKS